MRRLILNADDYGLTRGVSQGIRFAYSSGVISSTTAMMNLPGTARGVEIAQRDTPSLPIGVHLTLTHGPSITAPEKIPTLVDREGQFHSRAAFLERLDSIRPEETNREFRAQIEALLALGIQPDHLDSHHFVSYLSPALLEQMLALAEEYHLPIRPPVGCDSDMSEVSPGLPKSIAAFLHGGAQTAIRHSPILTADRLYITFYDKGVTRHHLQWILSNLPEGTSEIMCHPGVADHELRSISDYAEERGYELRMLTETDLPGIFRQSEIQLISYAQLNA